MVINKPDNFSCFEKFLLILCYTTPDPNLNSTMMVYNPGTVVIEVNVE